MGNFIFSLLILSVSSTAGGAIYGMNDFKYDPNFGDEGQGRLPIWSTAVIILLAVKTFAMLWALYFLSNTLIFITMVAASTYYFDSDANNEGKADLLLGFKWAYGPNFGSIAFASLVQAIVTFIREVL